MQFELYSSRVREFEVLGRQSHPRVDGADYAKSLTALAWQPLGRFTAANVKGVQVTPRKHLMLTVSSEEPCFCIKCY